VTAPPVASSERRANPTSFWLTNNDSTSAPIKRVRTPIKRASFGTPTMTTNDSLRRRRKCRKVARSR
jgi:hypothetical protein